MKKIFSLFTAITLSLGVLAGCGQTKPAEVKPAVTSSDNAKSGDATTTDLSGTITMLTNRTDIVDTIFAGYAAEFKTMHPNAEVKFEAMADYAGSVQTRMSTTDYGDVLLIPATVTKDQYPNFFLSLGKAADLSKKYSYSEDFVAHDEQYGISTGNNANGVIYNSKVLEDAGVTKLPETPEEFIDMLKKIKENTDAIPLYTNYAAEWTLGAWANALANGFTDDIDWKVKLIDDENAFAPGSPSYGSLKLLYDVVAGGYVEEDPITSDWELSKKLLADGKLGVMVIGSWAVGQIAGISANPENIKYMPGPGRFDGQGVFEVTHDYAIGVNKNTKHPELSEVFLHFFLEKYAVDSYMIPSTVGAELPDFLKANENVRFVTITPLSVEESQRREIIMRESQIDSESPVWIKPVIEIGLGNSNKSFDDYMSEVNTKYANGVKASK